MRRMKLMVAEIVQLVWGGGCWKDTMILFSESGSGGGMEARGTRRLGKGTR